MYIEKIFSNYEDNENLYSVILDEDEFNLYSEFQKEFGNPVNKASKKSWETMMAMRHRGIYDHIANKGINGYISTSGKKTVGEVLDAERHNFRNYQKKHSFDILDNNHEFNTGKSGKELIKRKYDSMKYGYDKPGRRSGDSIKYDL